ncbi:hypothetical protein A2U01_0094941, partial [Trifolium medium]|nr:hypothetical protein [Trifolium medium]
MRERGARPKARERTGGEREVVEVINDSDGPE